MVIKVDPEYIYVVSPDFDPTVIPAGYIWDETAFKELVKATDKATADETIYTYGGPQGDTNVDYLNAADLTISDLKYNGDGQVVGTTVTANAFNNTGTVTTEGAIVFSVKSFTNSGEFNLDKNGVLTATSAITNMATGTINLNAGSTLQGSTIGNAGTITVVSDHAAINGAISNHGMIDALMKKLTVTGDIQNAEADDDVKARDNSVIKAREFEVTGNVTNYGVIGIELKPDHTIDISGTLSNYRQVIADILTAGSIYNDSIESEVKEKITRGYIVAGEINAGSIDNVSGTINTSAPKETAVGINVTGAINNGNADNVQAAIKAGLSGWIQAASVNNIGTDIENSLIVTGRITAGDIVNNGGFSTRIVESTGTITNNATGLFAATFIDDPLITGLVEGATVTAATIINGGTFAIYSEEALPTPVSVTSFENSGMLLFSGAGMTLTGDIVNNADGQFDVAGTVTGTTATITNSGTFNISNDDDVSGVLTADAVTNTETGTINLNAGTTLQGSTIGNAGTITVVSDHATIEGAITNTGTIDALMKKLIVTGDIQNANKDDARIVRNASVIKARELEVTGNVLNYGAIGGESIPVNTMTVSGSLSTYNYLKATVLTADSILNDSIQSEVEGEGSQGFIDAGEINAGSVDNVSGIIMTGTSKETGVGINVTGTINNGSADIVIPAKINAGTNGWIKAASINNIGTDIENSLITAGKITVADIVNNGGFSTRIIENTGTITNNATGLFAVIYIDDPIVTGFVEGASINAGTIINGGTFAVYSEAALPTPVSVTSFENSGMLLFSGAGMTLTGDIVNNADGQFDVAGTVTGTTATITNSGTFNVSNTDDVSGSLTADAVTNTATGTINLDNDSTLTGATVINGGTITVLSGHAALNGAISNHGMIDSVMKTLNVTGDLQNANEDDMREARNSSIIKIRDLNVTGNVTNYGVIGTEWQEANDITISGDLRNYHQIIVNRTLTANSVYQDYIDSEVEEKRCVGYIICGQVIAGEINNASGEISAGADKDAGIAIEATGKITNGKADALFAATLQAGDDGCIQAVDALNNVGAGSTVHAGYITVLKGTEAGDLTNDGIIRTKSLTVDGSVTNSATGSIEIDGASTESGKLSGTSIANAGTLNLNGPVTLAGDVANSNLLNFQGTLTATGAITNAETGAINIKSAGAITGGVAVTNSGTLHIAIQSGNENKITAAKFTNTAGVGKITIGGSFAGGVASVITAAEGDVKVSDITLSVTSADEKEVSAAVHGGNVAIASGVDYGTIYLSNAIDESAIGTVVQDSAGASYYVDFNAFKLPASALEDGVRDATATILIDGATAGALKYESETTAAIDGLAFAKDGTNGATPEEEKNVEFVLTGMDPADPESYRDLKKGITVSAGVTLTVDKLRQSGKDAVTNISGELTAGTYNTGIADDPATADVDESVGTGTIEVAAGLVNVNGGGALYDCTVLSGGTVTVNEGGYAENATMENGGLIEISLGGLVNGVTVASGGSLLVYNGAKLTGWMTFDAFAEVIPFVGSVLDFDLTQTEADSVALVNDLSILMGTPSYTLTVDGSQADGTYNLAGGAGKFSKTITVMSDSGAELGTLTVGQTVSIGGVDYTLNLGADDVLSVTIGEPVPPPPVGKAAKFDVNGNGISDVMFIWTGNDYAHGYWLDGTNEWRSTGSNHPAEWENLGCYDMTGDGKADGVLVGNVVVEGVKGAYIGYYADAIDAIDGSTWVNIDYLNNEANITWVNKIGNLTGGSANSIVWYAPELYTLGAWTDGTSNWVTMTGSFGGDDWKLVGCGDFDGDGKDSVLMSGAGGAYFYAADLDGTVTSMGAANWSGWTVRAIGDFLGDGKDDLVLFHQELGSMVMLADGNLDDFTSIGQLDAADWFVVGAGDYNADQKDDLLVRQYSTGMLGYYSSGDVANGWVELGRGVGMEWTVIA